MSPLPDALSPLRLFACIQYFKVSCITNHILITRVCCLTSCLRPPTWLQPEWCHQVTERAVGGHDSVYFLMCAFVCVSSNGLDLVTTIATAGTLAAAAVLVWR